MAGSSIHPPKFEGDFSWWKKRMEVFFETDFDVMLIMRNGFEMPRDEDKNLVDPTRWGKKQKEEHLANSRALHHLLSVLPQHEATRIGSYTSAKNLWDKLVELHEGTSEAKLARRDLLRAQLNNLKLEKGEKVSSLHAKIKDILSGLLSVGETLTNRDIMMKAIGAFPRTTTWMSIVDSIYISKDLEKCSLDEFFSTMELHETRVESLEGEAHRSRGVAFVANKEKGKKKKTPSPPSSDSEDSNSSMNSDQEAYMVGKLRKAFKSFKSNKFNDRRSSRSKSRSRTIICYNCQKEGHVRDQCPLLKKKEEKERKREEKKKEEKKSKEKGKKAQNLKATWDDPSSSDEEVNFVSHFALMGIEDNPSTSSEREDKSSSDDEKSSSEEDNKSSNDEEEGSSSEEGGDTSGSEFSMSKVYSLPKKVLVKIISSTNDDLFDAKRKNKSLKHDMKMLEHKLESMLLKENLHATSSTSSNDSSLEEQNKELREKVEYLTKALRKFEIGSHTLDMIIRSQRASFKKKGLGYNENDDSKTYHCLIARGQSKTKTLDRKWIPKEYLVNPIRKNFYWVPKSILKG